MTNDALPSSTASLESCIALYRNEPGFNDSIHRRFTELTETIALLRDHRDAVEANEWGFGDRAFHFNWYLILQYAAQNFAPPIRCMEIGVYKGQVISLWALLARHFDASISIAAISPLQGDESTNRYIRKIQRTVRSLSPWRRQAFNKDKAVGNLYPDIDYEATIRRVFERFGLNLREVEIFKGFSTDPAIQRQWSERELDILYIDGDHSFDVSSSDIRFYAPLVRPGGICVLDDASYFLPGSGFHKGVESVSRAAELMPTLGFDNVLNVGHNRVYRRAERG